MLEQRTVCIHRTSFGERATYFLPTQLQTTARYAHPARDSIQNAAARIPGSIGGNLSSVHRVDETAKR